MFIKLFFNIYFINIFLFKNYQRGETLNTIKVKYLYRYRYKSQVNILLHQKNFCFSKTVYFYLQVITVITVNTKLKYKRNKNPCKVQR